MKLNIEKLNEVGLTNKKASHFCEAFNFVVEMLPFRTGAASGNILFQIIKSKRIVFGSGNILIHAFQHNAS